MHRVPSRAPKAGNETAAGWRERFPGRRIDTFEVDIRVAQAVEDMVQQLWGAHSRQAQPGDAGRSRLAPCSSSSR